ncbi:MAG: DUF6730 family protein [Salegentibacter sp.]|uniref:DUF6730 family protein n=1 Tax=Salegentibacter sp. TaxID=1903072 RepID=UPI00286FBA62|nr:DUF6730 family protein [Salegentibacter sp.]MDR9458368.1 DUF6730 family protein [Salegentibacter sp.]
MTKLEQLSELLVAEISQFEKTVEKLEKIQQQKIAIDTRATELLFKKHEEKVKEALEHHSREMKDLKLYLENAKAYPTWALILFCGSLIVNGILIYVFFT